MTGMPSVTRSMDFSAAAAMGTIRPGAEAG
ncbi:hypothetical protein M2275_003415 [Rhodococcus opacus]|nr:hypothetical protein [Rhodococcus opacus]